MSRRNRGGGGELGVLLLAYQLMSTGVNNVPPVTLIAIAGMTAVYLGYVPALDAVYETHTQCLQAQRVYYDHEWWRLFGSVVMHLDDMHLYFNMVSLLWKGSRLERRIGSTAFAQLLVVLSAGTSVMMVIVSVVLEEYMQVRQYGLMQQCAIGFSGVLFALKVICGRVLNDDAQSHYLFGIVPIPGRYACWTELLLIQVLVPNASFVGHLAGILTGLVFINCPPLVTLIMPNNVYTSSNSHGYWRSRWTGSGYGTTGGGGGTHNDYAQYTAGLSEQEQLRRAMHESRDTWYAGHDDRYYSHDR